ncbi:MAG TPA: lysophospholipid acyltransferase family protein [Gemmatimonadaceae bacterium]|nr:lysophospholipid acyltransferase family protein [Gemmatimonadaceae bacterium]
MSEPKKGPSLADRAQYLALRGVIGALDALSWRRAARLGEKIGALGYSPLGIRRDVVVKQIAAAFPGLSRPEVEEIARASYAHLGRTTIETALLPGFSREQILALFEGVDNWSAVEKAIAGGKGVILVTGHLGNWELGGAYLAARGIGLDVVARGMANPLFDTYLTSTRERIGMSVVHDSDAVRRTPRSLRAGRAVAFVSDQGVLGLASTFVPFFGMPAKTPRGPAVLALRLGVPVVFGCAIRQPSGRYVLSFEPVTVQDTGNREEDVDAVVAEYTKTLERWVRRAPEQYFWHHRRWRRQPPGTPEELRDPSR